MEIGRHTTRASEAPTTTHPDSSAALNVDRWSGASRAHVVSHDVPFDEPFDAPLCTRSDMLSADAAATHGARAMWMGLARIARNTLIGLSLVAALPLAFLVTAKDQFVFSTGTFAARIAQTDPLRVLRTAPDANVTPLMAGVALSRLMPTRAEPGFATRESGGRTTAWEPETLAADVFVGLRSTAWSGPNPSRVITQAAAGFSPAEVAVLQRIAAAPIWADVHVAATAERVDMAGGRFVTPFASTAWSMQMPLPRLRDVRTIAYAGVSRAAYFVAIGDHARAERTLQEVLTIGFHLIDHGLSGIEGLVGRVVVDAARDGLAQLYAITGDRRGQSLTVPFARPRAGEPQARRTRGSLAEVRAEHLRTLRDPTVPRSIKFEQLQALRWSTCGSLREVVSGPAPEVAAAFAEARVSLAHTDAERAMVDLIGRSVENAPLPSAPMAAPMRVVLGAAEVVEAVTGNSRVVACLRPRLGMF